MHDVLISAREHARRMGISHTAVQKQIRLGKISTTVDGKIRQADSDALLKTPRDPELEIRHAATRTTRQEQHHTNEAPALMQRQTTPAPIADRAATARQQAAIDPRFGDYLGNRAKREFVRLEKETLQLAKIRGKLLDADEIGQQIEGMIMAARTTFLAIPPRICSEVAIETDMQRCQEIIEAAIHEGLNKMVELRP